MVSAIGNLVSRLNGDGPPVPTWQLQSWARDFVVGPPIAFWLSPIIHVDEVGVQIRITTRDADDPSKPFSATFFQGFTWRGVHSREELHQFMRECLHNLVIHEVDEAIRVSGYATFNPHRSGTKQPEVLYR